MSQEHKTAALVFALLNFYDSVKLKKSKAVFFCCCFVFSVIFITFIQLQIKKHGIENKCIPQNVGSPEMQMGLLEIS